MSRHEGEGPWSAYIPPARRRAPANRQINKATVIIDEQKGANALKQLAISQNSVIKVFH